MNLLSKLVIVDIVNASKPSKAKYTICRWWEDNIIQPSTLFIAIPIHLAYYLLIRLTRKVNNNA